MYSKLQSSFTNERLQINLSNLTVTGGNESIPAQFLDAVMMSQHNMFCKLLCKLRHHQGHTPSVLDLIIASDPDMVDDVSYLAPLGSSDHVNLAAMVHVTVSLYVHIVTYNYRKGS